MASYSQSLDVYEEKTKRKVNPDELERFVCPICKNYLCDPVQITECGHRCCRTCVKDANSLTTCPVDNQTFQNSQVGSPFCCVFTGLTLSWPVRQLREDKGCFREMSNLKAHCNICGGVEPLSNIQVRFPLVYYSCMICVCVVCSMRVRVMCVMKPIFCFVLLYACVYIYTCQHLQVSNLNL